MIVTDQIKILNRKIKQNEAQYNKEELLKRLKNIEDKNKEKNKVQSKDIIEVTGFVDQTLSFKAKELLKKIKIIEKKC